MQTLSPTSILRKFLEHHNAHNNYINNRDGSAPFFLDYPSYKVSRMIDQCGFDWITSPEGSGYWLQLHRKWIDLCKEFNLTNQQGWS